MSYRQLHSLEERKREASQIKKKYPYSILCVVEKDKKANIKGFKCKKILVPFHFEILQLQWVIRHELKLKKQESILFFVNNILLSGFRDINSVYDQYRDEDGFLYIVYTNENTFG
ncbi:autophagy 8 [Neocallimastix lanati (nom. inval.)]|nr:autophagy 8 [Neocallimastix sp. JGI-2020a]